MKHLIQLSFFITIATTSLSAQWTQTNGPVGGLIYDIEQIGDKTWAGTSVGLFTSTQNSDWQRSDLVPSSFFVLDFYRSATEILVLCIKQDKSEMKILSTTNQGSTWNTHTVSNPFNLLNFDPPTNRLRMVKVNNRVYVYSNVKAYYQDNYSGPWSVVTLPGNTGVLNIAIDSNSIVARANSGGYKLFKSVNGGSNWASNTFFQGTNLYLEDSLIITKNSNNQMAVSKDWGNTWTYKPERLIDVSLINRSKDGKLYAGMGDSVFYSTDNGISWTGKFIGTQYLLYNNLTAILINDDITMLGTRQGIRKANSWDDHFAPANEGLVISSIRHITSNGKNKLYATTTADIFYSNDKGETWSKLKIPFDSIPPYFALLSKGDTVFLNGAYYNNGTPMIARSYDNGINWELVTLPGSVPTTLFVHYSYSEPLIWQENVLITRFFDETDNKHSFAISTDFGASWKMFDYADPVSSINVREMVYIDNKVYAIEYQGIIRVSSDLGDTWTKIFDLKNLDPLISDLDRLYKFGNTYYMTSSHNNILYSEDQFATVNLIKANGLPVNANGFTQPIAFMAHIGDSLFGITKTMKEILLSTDKGQNWTPYHNNLDVSWVSPTDVCVFEQQLYIGSQFAGVWRYGDIVSSTDETHLTDSDGQFLRISPNPATDHIAIQLPPGMSANESARLNLYSIEGQLLFYQNMTTSAQLNLTLPDLESGVYLLEVATEKGRSTGRLVKQ